MIAHFMRRDAIDHRISWYMVIVTSILATPFIVTSPQLALPFLGLSYYLFAMAPLHSMIGTTYRSQHIMSRHYLLALPAPRRKVFQLMFVRLLPFEVPLLLLLAVGPYISADMAVTFGVVNTMGYSCYLLALAGISIYFMSMAIGTQLGIEKFARCTSGKQRLSLFLFACIPFALEAAVVYGANYLDHANAPLGFTAVTVFVLAMARYLRIQRRWIVAG